MNNVLELKGKRFVQASKTGGGGGASMNSKKIVTREQLLRLLEKIDQIKESFPLNNPAIRLLFATILL